MLLAKNLKIIRGNSTPINFADSLIERGEKALILGPSGSGKTTLLLSLAGLLTPTEGSVFFNGKDIYKQSEEELHKFRSANYGFIFQTLHLIPSLTLRQNVKLATQFVGKNDDSRLDGILNKLNLSGKSNRKPEELSQGEQQRAAIARAVINRPQIILADEPTSALDDSNAQIVMDLLEMQASETGAALVIATHDSRIKGRFTKIIELESTGRKAA